MTEVPLRRHLFYHGIRSHGPEGMSNLGGGRPQETIAAAWLLFPAMSLLAIFVFWPLVYLLVLSFTQGSFTREGVYWYGIRNYLRFLVDPDIRQVLWNTFYFTTATVLPSLLLPLGLAVWLNRVLMWRGLLRAAYFIPSVTSLVAVGLGFRWLFQADGPVNQILLVLSLDPIPWLGSATWAMPVLILLSAWKQIGFNLVVFLAGLQTIPRSRYEAAELDGADAWAKFWYITLPGLRPTVVFAGITTVIFTLRGFEPIYVVTGGGPLNSTNILVYYTYQQAFAQFDFGYAAAAAILLVGVAFGLVYLQLRTWDEPID